MGKQALVQFFCAHPLHHEFPSTTGAASDHLTINEREWAYCAKDARQTDHVWEPTGGLTIAEVERFARHHDARRVSPTA